MKTFLAPIICLVGGIWSLGYTIYRWKTWWEKGGSLKLKTLIVALFGIPAGIAYLLQYFGVVNVQILAQGLGPEYYQNRSYEQHVKEINQQVANGEITQEKADLLINVLKK